MVTSKLDKKSVLIINRYFLPGIRAGGPIRSISNIVKHFKDGYNFHIVCLNKDFQSAIYKTVPTAEWIVDSDGNNVLYLDKKQLQLQNWIRIIEEVRPDVIYLNSFFDYSFSIKIQYLLARKKIHCKLVIAPRGEFVEGALKEKRLKKRLYLTLYNKLLKHKNTVYHATTTLEEQQIYRQIDTKAKVVEARNIPHLTSDKYQYPKMMQPLRICYCGRIHPYKNLNFAIEVLSKISYIPIQFNIIGAISDTEYWSKCKVNLSKLSSNITWKQLEPRDINWFLQQLASHHITFNPSLGENFGHAIAESLSVGTPVLISDKTPWRNLNEYGVGWDIPLNELDTFVNVIRNFAKSEEYNLINIRNNCKNYMESKFLGEQLTKEYAELF